MAERVTIQDIADALGLSRNTVSKAINNTGPIAEATKTAVLKKAAEMGYKQFSYLTLPPNMDGKTDDAAFDNVSQDLPPSCMRTRSGPSEIAFITTGQMDNSHFGDTMVDRISHELSLFGYSLTIYRLLPAEIAALRVPPVIHPSRTAGIICAELLDRDYCRMVANLSYPCLFVDFPVYLEEDPPKADVLLMDNESCIFSFIRTMRDKGVRSIAFIGDVYHCQSFFERYRSFRCAVETYGLPYDPSLSITRDYDKLRINGYPEYLKSLVDRLSALPVLPEVYICANDFVAIDLMRALLKMNIRIPNDIMVLGFDDSPESRILSPALSTVHIHSQTMGYTAVKMLLNRIQQPDLYSQTVHTETSLLLRASTER